MPVKHNLIGGGNVNIMSMLLLYNLTSIAITLLIQQKTYTTIDECKRWLEADHAGGSIDVGNPDWW